MDRWRSEYELSQAEWWTLEECRRHLDISERTLRRYKQQGLTVYRMRSSLGGRVDYVKRLEVQALFRGARHAEKAGVSTRAHP